MVDSVCQGLPVEFVMDLDLLSFQSLRGSISRNHRLRQQEKIVLLSTCQNGTAKDLEKLKKAYDKNPTSDKGAKKWHSTTSA